MKKAIIILIAVILGISCIACSGNTATETEKAFDVYLKTMENMDSITGLDAQLTSEISMNVAGQEMDITMDGQIVQVKRSDTDLDLKMDLTMASPALGVDNVNMVAYYTDGYYYMDSSGIKAKMSMDVDEMLSESKVSLFDFDVAMLKSSTVEKTADGNTLLTFVLDGTKAMDLAAGLSSSYMDELGAGDSSFTISDMKCEILVDSQYMPISEKISFTMDMDVSGQSFTMDLNMAVTYNEISDNITITFPDFSDYEEMDVDTL